MILPEPRPHRGYFGVGVYQAKSEANIGTLWRTAHNYRASFLFTIERRYRRQAADTTKAWRSVPLFDFADIDTLYEHLPYDCRLVGVELAEGAQPLTAYEHPERAVYLLGAEDHGLPPSVLTRCQQLVYVPGAEMCLNVATAGSIVLYDRWVKGVRLS